MPIYEYECRKCKAHIEVFQKLSDKEPTRCRQCGGRLERQLSAPAIQFKGSGWYVTDYANAGKKAGEKLDSDSSSNSSGDSDKKSEKKSKEASPPKKTSDKSSTTKAKS